MKKIRKLTLNILDVLNLCGKYNHAANCLFAHIFKLALKAVACVVVILKIPQSGFMVSLALGAVAFFVIDCFGPRGRDELRAREFGKVVFAELTKSRASQ